MTTNSTTYDVRGMTCGHCITAITDELVAVEHVTGVAVDLAAGKVAVTSDHPLDAAAVVAAIDAAGYEIAS
jgi:copper chaperone CopZ